MGSTGKATGGSTQYQNKTLTDRVSEFKDKYGITVGDRLINAVPEQMMNKILDDVQSVIDKNPEMYSTLQTITVYDNAGNAFAGTNGSTLSINPSYYQSNTELDSKYASSVASGFHPAGTTSRDIMAHELGHIANWKLLGTIYSSNSFMELINKRDDWAKNKTASKIVSEAARQVKSNWRQLGFSKSPTIAELKRSISTYATYNSAETIAEAWGDYHANGSNAKPMSRAIYEIINSRLQ